MKILSLLSGNGFVMYNKELAHSVSTNGAIIFGQLCSSYESFSSKQMLTIRDNKEYFFLTSEVLQRETALTYKQQLRATKDLEEAGYVETKMMGIPSKKFFHITNKIIEELISVVNPSSSIMEDLDSTIGNSPLSNDKRETLGIQKSLSNPEQKVSTIKKKNKKEESKNTEDILVNKEIVNNEVVINRLTNEYRIKGLSKDVCLRVVEEVNSNSGEIENFGGYLRTCLERTLYRSKVRNGEINPYQRMIERLNNSDLPY
ncbi:hypothetical protein [Bacillus sp. NTK071]|uniref:hypothetical protein n=1 Tax=Bacillus sp. NTK071 TaxID=2802175 RepID=UPI0025703AC8|nr:hypothetical protein [Bacillus sp. NTK071]